MGANNGSINFGNIPAITPPSPGVVGANEGIFFDNGSGNVQLGNVSAVDPSTWVTVPRNIVLDSGGEVNFLDDLGGVVGGYSSLGIGFGSASFYDSVNERLGVNVTSPTVPLDVLGRADFTSDVFIIRAQTVATGNGGIQFQTASGGNLFKITLPGSATGSQIGFTQAQALYYFGANSNISLAATGRITTGSTTGASAWMYINRQPSTTNAHIHLTPGLSVPTSPSDGDLWYDGTNIYFRNGAVTKTFTLV